MSGGQYSYAIRPTQVRTEAPIAWRFWPVSPGNVSDDLFDEIAEVNLAHNVAAIGYGNFPLVDTSREFRDFATRTKWNTQERMVIYQFTWQMRRGDIIFICKGIDHVLAWGLLLDNQPRFFEDSDPTWKAIWPARERLWLEGPREHLRNYHRVDHWRTVNARPRTSNGVLPGAPAPTVMSYKEADAIKWLRIKEHLTKARTNLAQIAEQRDIEERKPPSKRRTGQGRMRDFGRRSAVEWHAMDLAEAFYRNRGYEVEITADDEPYDLRCSKGDDVRRVEVKGTTHGAATVDLTKNEVASARKNVTDLFIVTNIRCVGEGDCAHASGGKCRHFADWEPVDEDLEPLTFRYSVPSGGRSVSVAAPDEAKAENNQSVERSKPPALRPLHDVYPEVKGNK